MVTRIVKLTFHADKSGDFEALFHKYKEKIADFPGCRMLRMYGQMEVKGVYFTYSHWETEGDLEKYRQSPLFDEVWRQTKSMFCAKPEAWTLDLKFFAEK